jgi:hypothetical protein
MLTFTHFAVIAYALAAATTFALACAHAASPAAVVTGSIVAVLGTILLARRQPSVLLPSLAGSDWKPLEAVLLLTFLPLLHVLLIPPYMRDDMIYHLLVPKLIASTGSLPVDPYNINANFPMLFEMPLVLVEMARPLLSPFLINLGMLILLAGSYYTLARGEFGISRPASLVALPLLVSTPIFYDLLHSAYVEIFFSLLLLLATFHYVKYCEDRAQKHHWYWSMALLGIACATKYFGLLFVAPVVISEFLRSRQRGLYYAGVALCLGIALPWYLKNWICLGNPVYPFLNELFSSPYVTAERLFRFQHLPQSYNAGTAPIDYLLLPLKMLAGITVTPRPGQLGLSGALSFYYLLCFIGIGFKTPRQNIPTLMFLGYTVFWLLTGEQVRYLLPAMLPVSLCGLARVDRFMRRVPAVAILCAAGILLQNGYHLAQSLHRERIDALITGRINASTFLSTQMPISYSLAQKANARLSPAASRILTVGNYGRNYYFDIPTLTTTYYDTEIFSQAFRKDSLRVDLVDKFVTKEHITHLLFNQDYFQTIYADTNWIDQRAVRAYLTAHYAPVLFEGPAVLLVRRQ